MQIGLIGFDTSHAVEFPKRLKALAASDAKYAGLRLDWGWVGEPGSSFRTPAQIAELQVKIEALGVKPVATLDELISRCDAFLLESVNGDTHLRQARPVFAARKPVYIDKPLAHTLADARAIARLAQESGTPCWSSSSLRFEPTMLAAKAQAGKIAGVDVFGPAHYVDKGRGLVFYGVHTAEMIVTVMGMGLETVQTLWHEKGEVAVGRYTDGRYAILRGDRNAIKQFGGTVYGEKIVPFLGSGDYYGALCKNLADFFLGAPPPVPLAESVEVIAFLDAAVRSKEANGAPMAVYP